MATFKETAQFRTTLDQAGRVAGLAGELGWTEAEVYRELVNMSLETPYLIRELRKRERRDQEELAAELESQGADVAPDELRVRERSRAS